MATMLRSKLIEDYVEARLADFKADAELPVDVYLYFSSNRHIMVWRASGEVILPEFLEKYRARGLDRVWIHRDDQAQWASYLKPAPAPSTPHLSAVPAYVPVAIPPAAPALTEGAPRMARTEVGQQITRLLESTNLTDRQRVAMVAKTTRDLLSNTAAPTNLSEQSAAMSHARDAVRDVMDLVLDSATEDSKRLVNDVWNLSDQSQDLQHAVNVATFSVLFSMAFGRIDRALIADIALAGLLHDVGICQITARVAPIPHKKQTSIEAQEYSRHVDESIRLLDAYGQRIPAPVKLMIWQHHEKFDGTGYPRKLQGFQVNDIAQLLSMADTFETMTSGQWDGETRTLQQTIEKIEGLEKARTFPEHFNPEVFSAIVRWMRRGNMRESAAAAADIVKGRTEELMKRNKLAS
jgi:HD-GYP domain-containing protein (c-di-GMP phosphodiesterase class II)